MKEILKKVKEVREPAELAEVMFQTIESGQIKDETLSELLTGSIYISASDELDDVFSDSDTPSMMLFANTVKLLKNANSKLLGEDAQPSQIGKFYEIYKDDEGDYQALELGEKVLIIPIKRAGVVKATYNVAGKFLSKRFYTKDVYKSLPETAEKVQKLFSNFDELKISKGSILFFILIHEGAINLCKIALSPLDSYAISESIRKIANKTKKNSLVSHFIKLKSPLVMATTTQKSKFGTQIVPIIGIPKNLKEKPEAFFDANSNVKEEAILALAMLKKAIDIYIAGLVEASNEALAQGKIEPIHDESEEIKVVEEEKSFGAEDLDDIEF